MLSVRTQCFVECSKQFVQRQGNFVDHNAFLSCACERSLSPSISRVREYAVDVFCAFQKMRFLRFSTKSLDLNQCFEMSSQLRWVMRTINAQFDISLPSFQSVTRATASYYRAIKLLMLWLTNFHDTGVPLRSCSQSRQIDCVLEFFQNAKNVTLDACTRFLEHRE